MAPEKPEDIKERTFRFALSVISLAESLPDGRSASVIAKQLIRSGTSVGANVEEAVAAHSREDFVYKMNIALREARETNYWLRIVKTMGWTGPHPIDPVLDESEQIMKILGAIVSKARGRRKEKMA
jgi:four helix bundle protein